MGHEGDGGLPGLTDAELTDQLASEYGYTPDYIWDDRPNVGRERGLTVGRLRGMLDERERRRAEDRRAFAMAMAYALNEPNKLDEVVPPPPKRDRPTKRDKGFARGRWWQAARGAGGDAPSS